MLVSSVFARQAAELKQADNIDHDEVRGSLDLVMAASMAMKLGVEASPEEAQAANRFLAFTQQHRNVFLQLGNDSPFSGCGGSAAQACADQFVKAGCPTPEQSPQFIHCDPEAMCLTEAVTQDRCGMSSARLTENLVQLRLPKVRGVEELTDSLTMLDQEDDRKVDSPAGALDLVGTNTEIRPITHHELAPGPVVMK